MLQSENAQSHTKCNFISQKLKENSVSYTDISSIQNADADD